MATMKMPVKGKAAPAAKAPPFGKKAAAPAAAKGSKVVPRPAPKAKGKPAY